jgi:hypothetical protein
MTAVLVASFAFGQLATEKMQIKSNGAQSIYITGVTATKGVIDDCPANSLGAEPWGTATSASVSEVANGYAVATEFSTIGGTIETIHVWMIPLSTPGTWNYCDTENPMTLNVLFIENDGGALGDTLHTFTDLSGSYVAAGLNLFDNAAYPVQFMTIQLPSGVDMTNGFMLIEGTSSNDPDCLFMWINSTDGTGAAYQYDAGWAAADAGFTYCLEGTPPDCAMPNNLATSNETTTTIDLSWDQIGTVSTWDIEYGAYDFTPTGTPTITGTSDNPNTIGSLTAGTVYDFYVRANCDGGDNSDWAGPITAATTNCEAADQCNYSFALTDSYGDGWNGGSIIVIENSIPIAQLTIPDGFDGTEEVAICDAMAVSLYFTAGGYPDEIGFTLTDPYGVELFAVAATELAAADDGTILYTFTSSCVAPDCAMPTALMAENITGTSVDFGWTSTGSLWNIEYGMDGFVMGEGTMVNGVTDNPYTLDGLDAVTSYDLYVQTDCGVDGTSNWAGPFSITTTLDGDYIVFDFEEGVPTGMTFVDGECGWEIGAAGSSDYFAIPDHGTYAYVNDDACNGDMSDVWMKLPAIDFTGVAAPGMMFENVRYNDIFTIKASIDGSEWTDVQIMSADEISEWTTEIIDLSAYADAPMVYIAFHYNDNAAWGYGWAVDDIMINGIIVTSIESNISETINVYPNPTSGTVNISNVNGASISVINMLGQEIFSTVAASDILTIDASVWEQGTYMVRIVNNEEVNVVKFNLVK